MRRGVNLVCHLRNHFAEVIGRGFNVNNMSPIALL